MKKLWMVLLIVAIGMLVGCESATPLYLSYREATAEERHIAPSSQDAGAYLEETLGLEGEWIELSAEEDEAIRGQCEKLLTARFEYSYARPEDRLEDLRQISSGATASDLEIIEDYFASMEQYQAVSFIKTAAPVAPGFAKDYGNGLLGMECEAIVSVYANEMEFFEQNEDVENGETVYRLWFLVRKNGTGMQAVGYEEDNINGTILALYA